MSDPATKYSSIADAADKLDKAQRTSIRWCEERGALLPGSSRARITTTNARWTQAAEHRDKCKEALEREITALGYVRAPAIDRIALATETLKLFGWHVLVERGLNPALLDVTILDETVSGKIDISNEEARALFALVAGMQFRIASKHGWTFEG